MATQDVARPHTYTMDNHLHDRIIQSAKEEGITVKAWMTDVFTHFFAEVDRIEAEHKRLARMPRQRAARRG